MLLGRYGDTMDFWKNKRVLVTGHTGFKGSWISLWLQQLGADVCGYALGPPTNPSLFEDARVEQGMRTVNADILDLPRLRSLVCEWKPEIIIHMAAQSLVRLSYQNPVETYAVNVMGTVNVLEAARNCSNVRSLVIVTTDKCYENREWTWGYRENDALGGFDPYSNSKACAELVVSAWRNSFFNPIRYHEHGVSIASVRAGNVIGGGDWAKDRLVPDLMRALASGNTLMLRNPDSTRPWQYVLEPLYGYLLLAERLYVDGPAYSEAFNFGPENGTVSSVAEVADRLTGLWGTAPTWQREDTAQLHEAKALKLDCSKAADRLNWRPVLSLDQVLQFTTDWYRARAHKEDMWARTCDQIRQYSVLIKCGWTYPTLHEIPSI